MVTKGAYLLQYNALSYLSNATKQLLDSFGGKVLNPQYCPNLAPLEYHLFPSLKMHMGGKRFSTDEEMERSTKVRGSHFAGDWINIYHTRDTPVSSVFYTLTSNWSHFQEESGYTAVLLIEKLFPTAMRAPVYFLDVPSTG